MISRLIIFILLTVALFAKASDDKENQLYETPTEGIIYNWKVNQYYDQLEHGIDTSLEYWQHLHPLYRNKNFYAYTGNLGGSAISSEFGKRLDDEINFFFANAYAPYLSGYTDRVYYNTKKPFTKFHYNGYFMKKDKMESNLLFLHTQNINEKLNIGFKYDFFDAEGSYAQQSKKRSMVKLFLSYNSEKYEAYVNASNTIYTTKENGGLVQNSFENSFEDSKLYPTNIKEAYSRSRLRNLDLLQKLYLTSKKFSYSYDTTVVRLDSNNADSTVIDTLRKTHYKKWISLSYNVSYNDAFRWYEHADAANSFYNYTIDSTGTFDSAAFRSFRNEIQLEMNEPGKFALIPALQVYYRNDVLRYQYYEHSFDTNIHGNFTTHNLFNSSVGANALHRSGRVVLWRIGAEYFLNGYRKDDYRIDAEVNIPVNLWSEKALFQGRFSNELKQPDYFLQEYSSNNSPTWNNSFKSEERQRVTGKLFFDKLQLSLGADFSIQNNFIFFNHDAVPEQFDQDLSVLDMFVDKKMRFGRIVFDNKLSFQSASHSIVRLPPWMLYNSTYYDRLFNFAATSGRLRLMLGVDTYISGVYTPYSYSTNLNQFYLQDEFEDGLYPFMDLFANVEIKRFRLYVKVQHVNQNWFGDRKGLRTVNYYPLSARYVKFGFAWRFYN